MEIKRPFTDEDWDVTPEPVRRYIIQLEGLVIKLIKETGDLKKRVTKLENSLNQNSQNSSKPPSSDPPYKKPSKESKESKRNRGGQKGHKGHQQKLMTPISENILLPETCSCGCLSFDPESIKPFYTHQVIELPEIEMDVRHFILNQGTCIQCGNVVKAQLPCEHKTGYGPRLSALIAETSGIQGNSRETIRTFCQSVLGVSISSGAIQKIIDRASEALKPVHEKIGNIARNSYVNYIDETSWFQNGALKWLWVMVNSTVAYFMIHKNRSKQAFLDLVQDWDGILVSDNYGVYQKWINLRQTCLAHLIRKAKALAERKDPITRQFGQQITKDLQLLCHWAKVIPEDIEWRAFYQHFTDLIFDHQEHKGEVGTLARSLIRQIESLWLFLDIVEVEPTNNFAERTLRYGVLWRKRSKGTQSEKGNRWVERILSFKQTCSIRSLDSFPLLVELLASYFKEQEPDLSWI
ncbi:IS66 family transposase [Desulfobacula sp.]|uniref:IS66 family transposase n=1 Tax=Desulfobacula sp. TaxID=2593537 RepID=UPI00263529CE|nr:IS66 family transposase [Desulfobacula sp.]